MTDNRTTELLPCWFCGGEAETHETIDGWIAACGSEQSELDGFTHKAQAYGTTEAEAIAAWNARAERTCRIECFDDGVDEGLDGEWFSYAPPTWYLSCGHTAEGLEAPKFCSECGARVEVDA